mmetsp:Transcript_13339/g.48560  ORF Transcript_13339/g.48560 Transcript_13339/m.48560 type:complete len:216 (-) Transcript_13339:16-663(-)
MHLIAKVLQGDAATVLRQHDWFFKVWLATRRLGVHPHQSHFIPHVVKQSIEIQSHVTTNDHRVGLYGNFFHFLECEHVDFVVHVQAPHVFAIAFDHVNELIDCCVFAKQYFGIMDLVLVEDLVAQLLVYMRQGHHTLKGNPTCLLHLEVNVRWSLVQSDAHGFQLTSEDRPVPFLKILDGIQHHQDKIGRLGRRNHLASPTLALRGPFNYTGQIE